MPLLIGMDEAGYGPNLGPLVVTVVAWEVPGDPRRTDLWNKFAEVVSPEPCADNAWLQIGDSKAVYTPARGLGPLEIGVLAALGLWRRQIGEVSEPQNHRATEDRTTDAEAPATLARLSPAVLAQGENRERADTALALLPESLTELRRWLAPHDHISHERPEPWHRDFDLPVPHTACCRESLARSIGLWQQRCEKHDVRLRAIHSDVVTPQRFNSETRKNGNKAAALSHISMGALAHVWRETGGETERALVIADKHGGRNRYHDFLPAVFGDRFIQCREEGLDCSRYQIDKAEVRFETKSERHLPVALASMVSKYVRELSMVLFNRFWSTHQPGLKPTAGYPVDSSRFRRDISETQRKLGVEDDVLWRER